ncbi:MAG: rhomboid family intramembrane serine protease [Acidobacteria bacterium]|nr:rhomboid family intramembrane serine protease [Acidobacteriota bacterium]
MIPYHDENETQRTAYVTMAIIVLCALAWVVLQGLGAEGSLVSSVCELGLIPGELTGMLRAGMSFPMTEEARCVINPGPQYFNVLSSMFLHGGWMHLIGNMWFLWLFGNNIEDSMTRPRFIAFYLLCGVGAALAQVVAAPDSFVPMVGASGAISGVMGGYLVLYPRVRVFTILPLGFFFTTITLPAWGMLVYWMVIQIFGGLAQSVAKQGGGVAFWAHIGGFVAGVVLIKIFAKSNHIAAHEAQDYRPQRVGWGE